MINLKSKGELSSPIFTLKTVLEYQISSTFELVQKHTHTHTHILLYVYICNYLMRELRWAKQYVKIAECLAPQEVMD